MVKYAEQRLDDEDKAYFRTKIQKYLARKGREILNKIGNIG